MPVNYLREDSDEVYRIADAVCFTSQLTERLFSLSSIKKITVPTLLKEKLLNNYSFFISEGERDMDLIRIALVIFKYIDTIESQNTICEILYEINDWSSLNDDYSLNAHFKEFMDLARQNDKINDVIEEKIVDILTDLVTGEDNILEVIKLLEESVEKYDVDLDLLETTELEEHINPTCSQHINISIKHINISILLRTFECYQVAGIL